MKVAALSILFFSIHTFAALLEFSGKPMGSVKASGHEVPLYPQAKALVTPTAESLIPKYLKLTGAGVREKSVFVVTANVYIAVSYSDGDLKHFSTEPLKAIAEGTTEAIQLTLLRDLSAEKIRESFQGALEANEVSITSEPIQNILNAVNTDLKEGQVISIVSQKGKAGETVFFDIAGKTVTTKGPTVGTDFWKIWFGKPADKGLESLQKQLIGMAAVGNG